MAQDKSSNVVWHHATVTRDRREALNGHRSVMLWFTGLSGAGKSTLAHSVEEYLYQNGCRTFTFDGDNGEMAKLFLEAGVIALTAFISPFRSDREKVRSLVPHGEFFEIYCRCPLDICEVRDIKGLYKRARAGEIKDFTGISSPYEEPVDPELVVDTGTLNLEDSVAKVVGLLRERGVIGQGGN